MEYVFRVSEKPLVSAVSENVHYRRFVFATLQGFEASGSIPRPIVTHILQQAALRQSSKHSDQPHSPGTNETATATPRGSVEAMIMSLPDSPDPIRQLVSSSPIPARPTTAYHGGVLNQERFSIPRAESSQTPADLAINSPAAVWSERGRTNG